jgi:hypothetical protein
MHRNINSLSCVFMHLCSEVKGTACSRPERQILAYSADFTKIYRAQFRLTGVICRAFLSKEAVKSI